MHFDISDTTFRSFLHSKGSRDDDETEERSVRGHGKAEERGPGNARKAQRPAGEGDPVVHDAEDDDLEGEGRYHEIVVMGLQ